MPRWSGPRKYDPLGAYLAQHPADRVTLTLAEIEAILGAALPASARSAAFWSNYEGHAPARAWGRVGWRTARHAARQPVAAVMFVRAAPDTTTSLRVPPRPSPPATARQRRDEAA